MTLDRINNEQELYNAVQKDKEARQKLKILGITSFTPKFLDDLEIRLYVNGYSYHDSIKKINGYLNKQIDLKNIIEKSYKAVDTKSFQVLCKYIEEVYRDENFIQKVEMIRKKFKIPANGYIYGQNQKIDKMWRECDQKLKPLEVEANKICDKYHLFPKGWGDIFFTYILYNWPFNPNFITPDQDLCIVRIINPSESQENKYFPIGIKISPYAKEMDIIDFIKKEYKNKIQPYQMIFRDKGCKIGRINDKQNQKISDFIYAMYKKGGLTMGQIAKIVNEKFNTNYIYTDISKRIYLEKERRKL